MSKKLYVIVDNTWLTEEIFNPLYHFADFLVISFLTKYYSAGNEMGGAILAKRTDLTSPIMNIITEFRNNSGSHLSPFSTCDIILNNMSNIKSRINKASKLVFQWFNHYTKKPHPKLISVIHPYFEEHPSHDLMKKYFSVKLIPSVFLIVIKYKRKQMEKNLKKCKIFDYKTSFGYKHSRFDPYCFAIDDNTYVRISIGYDDNIDTVINGINELLDLC